MFIVIVMLSARMITAAQADDLTSAEVIVHVTDVSEKPIWLARVVIYGKEALIAESNRNGDATFSPLAPGVYRIRIERYGFVTIDVPRVAVDGPNAVRVVVRLAKLTLPQIAQVSIKASRPNEPNRITTTSPAVEISGSLVDALHSLPGVVTNAGQEASVDGYRPEDTTVAINGVPVSLPGSAAPLQMFNADVFSDASVMPSSGGGGTLSFQTASPTLDWQGTLREILSAHNGEDIALQERGTAGDVGVSFTHAWHTLSDPLEGRSYLDSSGLFYAHRAASAVNANAAQLRYELSPSNTMLFTALSLSSTIPIVCRVWTGVLPCGYGPTNLQQAALKSYQIRDVIEGRNTNLDLTLYDNSSADFVNQTGYYAGGVWSPTTSLQDSLQRGFIARTQLRLGNALVPLDLSGRVVNASSTGTAFGTLTPAALNHFTEHHASTVIPLYSRPRFQAHMSLGINSNNADGQSATKPYSSLDLDYTMHDGDSINASFSPGNLGGPTVGFEGISSPSLLNFLCTENIAIGSGPSAAQPGATQTQTTLNWSHSTRNWSSRVNIFENVQFNAPVNADVNAASLNPSLFPVNYLNDAANADLATCGSRNISRLSDLFFSVTGVASRVVRQGMEVNAAYDLGPTTVVSLGYATTKARAYGDDPMIFNARSTVAQGRQLPNVPIESASLALKKQLGVNSVALLQANYMASNNPYNLPPYISVDAGLLLTMPTGLLSLTMTNIGNVHAGPFATANGAVPLPMSNGSFPTIAQPIAPATFNIGYRFHLGTKEQQISFSVPEEQFQPLTAGFPIFVGGIPVSRQVARNAFGIDRASVRCGPKDVSPAQYILHAWQQYVMQINEATSDGVLPETFAPVSAGAVQFNYRKTQHSYVVFLSQAPGGTLDDMKAQARPIEECATIHSASEQQIKNLDLYEFPSTFVANGSDYISSVLPLYAPEVGLYHGPYHMGFPQTFDVQPQNLRIHGSAPPPRPDEPFAIKPWAGCSTEFRSAAKDMLDAIQSYAHEYFDLHRQPKASSALIITPHNNGSRVWISIRAQDESSLRLLMSQCMYVRLMLRADVQRLGLGSGAPGLNYTPGIGLYEAH